MVLIQDINLHDIYVNFASWIYPSEQISCFFYSISILNKNDQLNSALLSSYALITKTYMRFSANISNKLLNVLFCVNTNTLVCWKSIVSNIEFRSSYFNSMFRKILIFFIKSVSLYYTNLFDRFSIFYGG